MKKIKTIPYTGREHGSFEHEWLSHKKASEWWYATGLVNDDESGCLFSYQFVIIKSRVKLFTFWTTQLALTDFETGKHYYFEKKERNDKRVTISDDRAVIDDLASVVKGKDAMKIIGHADEFSFDMECEYGKGAFWHCDNGYLLMGTPTTKESTFYYSYTNMPAKGKIKIGDKTFTVSGKNWFDKQGGPFNLISNTTHWEWFSFRFFDDEEVMLFAFPQNEYYDGTYIKSDCTSERLNNYHVKTTDTINVDGLEFSSKWDIHLPGIKDEHYNLIPLLDCQKNGSYFELVAEVTNMKNEKVGYCVIELLPGVRNKSFIGKM